MERVTPVGSIMSSCQVPFTRVDDLEELLEPGPYKLLIIQEEQLIDHHYKNCRNLTEGRAGCSPDHIQAHLSGSQPPQATKGTALKNWQIG